MTLSSSTRLTLADIPELPRYVTVAQAAKMFGITKMSVYYKIYDQRRFDNVFRLGGNPDDASADERPILLLLRSEVEDIIRADQELAKRRATTKAHSPEFRLNEWNKRIKQWGREVNFNDGQISEKGQPSRALVEAYLQANPEDVKPV